MLDSIPLDSDSRCPTSLIPEAIAMRGTPYVDRRAGDPSQEIRLLIERRFGEAFAMNEGQVILSKGI